MISLASEMTDSKSRHARGWLFFDAECEFCTRIASWLIAPMNRRGLAVAPLQDPRVGALLGLSREELLSAIRFVSEDGSRYSGADAVLAVMRELPWTRPLLWMARVPGTIAIMRLGYRWVARHRCCPAECCTVNQVSCRS
jgi:predicted DCC family thiol-disulfide oxidoreductase YuxK